MDKENIPPRPAAMLAKSQERFKAIQRLEWGTQRLEWNSQRSRRATREPSVEQKTIDFLAFPFEIRSMVYTYIFSYERLKKINDIVYDSRPGLGMKSPILRTSKLVRREALPFLYRHHLFCVRIPMNIPTTPAPRSYGSITKVQLVFPLEHVEIRLHRSTIALCTRLQHLLDCLPKLQCLRIRIPVHSTTRERDNVTFRTDLPLCELLSNLWQRLSRLEIYLSHSHKVDTSKLRHIIAPDAHWVLEICGKSELYPEDTQKSLWVAQRDGRPPRRSNETDEIS